MSIIIAVMVAGQILPTIDRHSLDLQARAEVRRSAPVDRLAPRRASGSNALDFSAITTICRAAGRQADPAAFVGRLSRAYSMSVDEGQALRASCAAYLAGSEDARRTLKGR